jgi:hypothetical protein
VNGDYAEVSKSKMKEASPWNCGANPKNAAKTTNISAYLPAFVGPEDLLLS